MQNPQLSAGGIVNTSVSAGRFINNHSPRHNIIKATPANTPSHDEPLHERRNHGLIHINAYITDALQSVNLREH